MTFTKEQNGVDEPIYKIDGKEVEEAEFQETMETKMLLGNVSLLTMVWIIKEEGSVDGLSNESNEV